MNRTPCWAQGLLLCLLLRAQSLRCSPGSQGGRALAGRARDRAWVLGVSVLPPFIRAAAPCGWLPCHTPWHARPTCLQCMQPYKTQHLTATPRPLVAARSPGSGAEQLCSLSVLRSQQLLSLCLVCKIFAEGACPCPLKCTTHPTTVPSLWSEVAVCGSWPVARVGLHCFSLEALRLRLREAGDLGAHTTGDCAWGHCMRPRHACCCHEPSLIEGKRFVTPGPGINQGPVCIQNHCALTL